jgi:hypothetical protein
MLRSTKKFECKYSFQGASAAYPALNYPRAAQKRGRVEPEDALGLSKPFFEAGAAVSSISQSGPRQDFAKQRFTRGLRPFSVSEGRAGWVRNMDEGIQADGGDAGLFGQFSGEGRLSAAHRPTT